MGYLPRFSVALIILLLAMGPRSSGGWYNTASGIAATVAGGHTNSAEGAYSFAAGHKARALYGGSFVWGDSTDSIITSPAADTFVVRANGGIWFGTATAALTPTIGTGKFISTSTGAYLSTSGTWTDVSDRNVKENFEPVDPEEVLRLVATLPVQAWNYKAEDPSVRHMGPMAQDFYATFGLGQDDKHIAALDASGVTLAAIQGLYAQVQELEAENAELQARVDNLEARLAALEARSTASTQGTMLWPSLILGGLGLVWVLRRKGEEPPGGER